MPQPPFAARVSNFLRDANAGLESPAPLAVDAELNAILNVLNQLVLREREKTNADGTLKNVAAATAQALAGAQTIVATASQSVFTTTIVWSAAFSTSNVFVFVGGLKISVVSVADNGGFLEVTIAAQPISTSVDITAFESGAGLLTRLQTAGSATDGAHLVAIQDNGGLFTGVTVEAALQEEATARAALAAAIGNTADLIKRTGTVPFTANQSLGGNRLTNVGDGVGAQDAVTMNQFAAYTAVWAALETYFLRLDGTSVMAADLPMGGNQVTNLGAGVAGTDAVNKTQLDTKLSLTGGTVTGAIEMSDQFITGLKDAVLPTDALNLRTAQSIVAAFSRRAQYAVAGTSPFVVPAGVSKIRVRCWGGGAGGGAADSAARYGGGAGAYAEAVLTVTPAESLTITVGAGGAAETDGGNTIVQRGATTLMQSNGGIKGTTTGLGGAYSFDGSVTGFGINGGSGHGYRVNSGAGEPTAQTGGHGGSSPMGGAGGQATTITAGGSYGNTTAGNAPGGGGGAYPYSAAAGAAGRCEIEY